jgi:hypothetical protein
MFVSKTVNQNHAGILAVLIAVISILISLSIFFNRFGMNLDTPIKSWVDTAVYFNNVLTPVLALITVGLLASNLKSMKEANNLVINQIGLDLFVKQVQITRDQFLDDNLFSFKLDVCGKLSDVLGDNSCLKRKVEEFDGIKPLTINSLVNKTIDIKFDVKTCLQLYKYYKKIDKPLDVVGLIKNSDNLEKVLRPLMGEVIVEKISNFDKDENITNVALNSFKYLLEELYKQKEEALYTLYIKSFKMNFDTDLVSLIFEFDTKLLNKNLKEELERYM